MDTCRGVGTEPILLKYSGGLKLNIHTASKTSPRCLKELLCIFSIFLV